MRSPAVLTLVLPFALGVSDLLAQTVDPGNDSPSGWEIGAYVGVARHSPVGTHLGVTPDRNHLFIGLHPTKAILTWEWGTLAYAPEVVPLLLISDNPHYRTLTLQTPDGPYRVRIEDGSGPVAGFAIAPVGFETLVRIAPRWRVYGGGAVGVVWFTREVPMLYSRAFNYTFEFGGGVQWRYSARQWLRLGYKFHHLSNAYTAPNNPGIDGHVFTIGFGVALGSARR